MFHFCGSGFRVLSVDVDIGPHSQGAAVTVAEPAGERWHVYPASIAVRREDMAKIVDPEMRELEPLARGGQGDLWRLDPEDFSNALRTGPHPNQERAHMRTDRHNSVPPVFRTFLTADDVNLSPGLVDV